MQFYEKLDCLMKLTDISNSELSKKTNIDPSLVSRWRRGIKTPDVFSDVVNHIAAVLAQRINNDLRRQEFSSWVNCPAEALEDTRQITTVILEWFRKSTDERGPEPHKLTGRRPYPSYEQRRGSPMDPYSLPEAHRFGPEGRKQALSWILSFVEYWTVGSGTLRFYTDQPFEYLDTDCSYYENRFRENAYAEKFRIVKILQPVTATEQERLRALQFASLFMNTTTVSIAFIEQKDVSIFQHSLGIYDNQMAICSYGFYGSRFTSSYVHMDETFVHELTNEFDIHFDSARIALQPNIRFTLQDMYNMLSNFYEDREDLYYSGIQLFLPFVPPELLSACAQHLETQPETQDRWREQAERFRNFLCKKKVFATFPLLSPEDFRYADTAPYIFMEKNCRIIFSHEQYLKILQYVLELYYSIDNLELSFLPVDPDVHLWSNPRRLLYSYSGNCFVPYQSNHPTFIQPLDKIQTVFYQTYLKRNTRAQTRQLLIEHIRRFGGQA